VYVLQSIVQSGRSDRPQFYARHRYSIAESQLTLGLVRKGSAQHPPSENEKKFIVIKSFRLHTLAFSILLISLFACQDATNEVVCQPASSPFATPSRASLSDLTEAYKPNSAIGRVCSWRGVVVRAQVYTQQITEGLTFCLRPHTTWHENDGWEILISDTAHDRCSHGFNAIVTPPFHGENPVFIAGYQFRNADNTAPNDGSVNAPQEVRSFNFLFSQKDYETVWSAHNCLARNECENGLSSDDAVKVIAITPKSAAVMTITDLELGNLIPHDHAWIESIKFEVKIYLPAE
jgi:hypothetical protein